MEKLLELLKMRVYQLSNYVRSIKLLSFLEERMKRGEIPYIIIKNSKGYALFREAPTKPGDRATSSISLEELLSQKGLEVIREFKI